MLFAIDFFDCSLGNDELGSFTNVFLKRFKYVVIYEVISLRFTVFLGLNHRFTGVALMQRTVGALDRKSVV